MLRDLATPATIKRPEPEQLQMAIAAAWRGVWPEVAALALGLDITRAGIDALVHKGEVRKVMLELDREARDRAAAAERLRAAGYALKPVGDGFVATRGAFEVIVALHAGDRLLSADVPVEPGGADLADLLAMWPADVVELLRGQDVRFAGLRFAAGEDPTARIRYNVGDYSAVERWLVAHGFTEEPYRRGLVPWLEEEYLPPDDDADSGGGENDAPEDAGFDGDAMVWMRDRIAIVGGGTQSAYLVTA